MKRLLGLIALVAMSTAASAQDKPNMLIIWGDDIGQSNISAYTMGLMGYRTPNIDRIATEGLLFTDYYGEQSCTAGRSSYITGQSVYRTGLSKVGLPGAALGMQVEDPNIPGLLKAEGYVTGQFGKPRTTASMSSSATCITSMPKKSPRTRTILRIPRSVSVSDRVASSSHRQTARSRTPAR
jgi:hypothetical protein